MIRKIRDSLLDRGARIAMLHQGRIRQVGTVEEIQESTDPIVRQFIEGRPAPDSAQLGV